ncbi:sensor histidine kinase [Nonomuraea roseoviolacea]|uniref:histidine kinase n=1 Tax=Nonomuraea roseoviolacea subsp. carminata TaxID=160689 RepID=A0ABT1K8R4_9ACTN|nr:histidine kinase [Nonomuraea roseoviolacea]MCP2350393.1 signal transduction histidine kinase [Nonomuraea roseoviolacea subsp. carminata]
MQVTPPPLLKRVPPGAWAALAWCAGLAFTFLMRIRLPGEWEPALLPGALLYQVDGLTFLAVATGMTLAACRLLTRRPLVALGLMLASSVIACVPLGVGEIPFAQYLAVDVALYVIAAARSRRTARAALFWALALLGGYLTTRTLFGWPVGTSAELAVAMGAVIAWLIGRSSHQAREHAEALTARAAAQAVTDERLRISRDLHDTVAHSMGVIALQAGAARRVIDTQPARAREALAEIEAVGRETLSGLRRMVGTLRQPEAYDSTQAAVGVPSGHPQSTPHGAAAPSRIRVPGVIARIMTDRLAMTPTHDQASARPTRRVFGDASPPQSSPPSSPLLSLLERPTSALHLANRSQTDDSGGVQPVSSLLSTPTAAPGAADAHLDPGSATSIPGCGAAVRGPVPDLPPGSRERRPAPPRPHLMTADREEDGRLSPGLANLDRLAATTTQAGVRVDVRRLGKPRPLRADLDVSAYRVIQEAVTNVVRHAAVDSCQVSVEYHQDALSIEILNDGPIRSLAGEGGFRTADDPTPMEPSTPTNDRTPAEAPTPTDDRTPAESLTPMDDPAPAKPPAPTNGRTRDGGHVKGDSLAEGSCHAFTRGSAHASGSADPAGESGHGSSGAHRGKGDGFGLTGMRERVHLLDGEFFAGPRPQGGFRVAVRLPLPAGA